MCLSHELPDIHFTGNGVKHNSTSEDSKVLLYNTCTCICMHFDKPGVISIYNNTI